MGGIYSPEEQITLNGNILPTKEMIKKIKKYGFKTIRIPVTWVYFIDDYGNVRSDWMLLVKKVVDLVINADLYCILNIYLYHFLINYRIQFEHFHLLEELIQFYLKANYNI